MNNKPLEIKSDNLSVRYLSTLKNAINQRLIRWSILLDPILSRATFTKISSKDNVICDSLSRLESKNPIESSPEEDDFFDGDDVVASLNSYTESDSLMEQNAINNKHFKSLFHYIENANNDKFEHDFYFEQNNEEFDYLNDKYERIDANSKAQSKNLVNFQNVCNSLEADSTLAFSLAYENNCIEQFGNIAQQKLQGESLEKTFEALAEVFNREAQNLRFQNDSSLASRHENVIFKPAKAEVQDARHSSENSTLLCNTEEGSVFENKNQGLGLGDNKFVNALHSEQTSNLSQTQKTSNQSAVRSDSIEKVSRVLDAIKLQPTVIVELQESDPYLRQLRRYLSDGCLPLDENKKLCKKIVFESNFHFLNENNELCYIQPNKNKFTNSLWENFEVRVMPKSMAHEIISNFHAIGHSGIGKLTTTIRRYFTWPGLWSDIKHFVTTCKQCITSKRGLAHYKAELKPFDKPVKPFDQLHFDIMEINSATESGNKILLTAVCAFSGYVFLKPCPDGKAETVAKKLLEIFSDTGLVKTLISDVAPSFMSKIMQSVWDYLKIKHIHITPYHSSSNSKIERVHRSVGDSLRCVCSDSELRNNWDDFIPIIQLSLRTMATEAYPLSPFYILHGFDANNYFDLKTEDSLSSTSIPEFVNKLKTKVDKIHKIQNEILAKNADSMKSRYDHKIARPNPEKYRVGQKVWLKHEPSVQVVSAKFKRTYHQDIYVIEEVCSDYNVRLKNLSTGKILKNETHVDKIKPYVERKSPEKSTPSNTETLFMTKSVKICPEEANESGSLSPTEGTLLEDVPVVSHSAVGVSESNVESDSKTVVSESKDQNIDEDGSKIMKQKLINGEKYFLVKKASNETNWVSEHTIAQHLVDLFYETHRKSDGKKRKRKKHKN